MPTVHSPGRPAAVPFGVFQVGERRFVTASPPRPADARPFQDTARAKSKEAEQAREKLRGLKKTRPRDESAIAEAVMQQTALSKDAREAAAKAEAIENAVYDLKTVNPNRKANTDTRTPDELLNLIEAKGREITAALAALRRMSQTPANASTQTT